MSNISFSAKQKGRPAAGLAADIQARIETIGLINDAHIDLLQAEEVPVDKALELIEVCREHHLYQKAEEVMLLLPAKYRKKKRKASNTGPPGDKLP